MARMLTIMERLVDGEQILEVRSPPWLAEVVLSRGANLCRLRHASGMELLRTPPSMSVFRESTEMWGLPVLFPPNRISHGRFSFMGRNYHFPVNDRFNRHHIHGMVSRQPWQLEQTAGNTLTLRFSHTEERQSYSWFPHRFVLRLHYSFCGDQIKQTATVNNCDALPMPFGFGFHTAFRLPFSAEGSAEHCRVRVTAGEWQWEMSKEDCIPTGIRLPLDASEWAQGIRTEIRPVFVHAPILVQDGFCGAIIESPKEQVRVVYEVDKKFRNWVLWNHGGGKGFFCPEPQTWAINAPNLPQADAMTGFQSLLPRAEWSVTSHIRLERTANAQETAIK